MSPAARQFESNARPGETLGSLSHWTASLIVRWSCESAVGQHRRQGQTTWHLRPSEEFEQAIAEFLATRKPQSCM